MKANEFFKKVGIEAVKSYIVAYEDHLTDELKRLVESWDLVELCGGLEVAKNLDPTLLTGWVELVNKAILDVESCQ